MELVKEKEAKESIEAMLQNYKEEVDTLNEVPTQSYSLDLCYLLFCVF